jgi:hypothetical protein
MSRSSTLILLGILTILTPFSGLPSGIRTLFAVVFGATVLGIGLMLRSNETRRAQSPAETPAPAPELTPPQDISPI